MRVFLLLLLASMAACAPSKRETIIGYYNVLEQRGGFRTERAPEDATFDNDDLAQSFRLTAFEFEEDPFGTGEVREGPRSRPMLRRWEDEINYLVLSLGAGSDGADDYVETFIARLRGLTGRVFRKAKPRSKRAEGDPAPDLMIAVGSGQLFDLMIAEARRTEDDDGFRGKRKLSERLAVWHRSTSPCAGWLVWQRPARADDDAAEDNATADDAGPPKPNGTITFAFVAVRSDLSETITQSCLEEEIAQVMGLPNDNDAVRPSLFNDDEEFALLTRHDEMLLKILYDPRLSPGMIPGEAMPIVRTIARELTGGS